MLVWLEDTRGQSLRISNDHNGLGLALQQFLIWLKDTAETAEREGKLYDESEYSKIVRNYAWLLQRDQTLTYENLHLRYCTYLARGVRQIAPESELALASEAMAQEIFAWLSKWEIPFHKGPLVRIPTTSIQKALVKFSGVPDIHFSPSIPQDKLANAINECGMPEFDSVAVLIDCTFWGSAKDAILFGERGMYYKNSVGAGFVPYSEFMNRTFNLTLSSDTVSIGAGRIEVVSLSGSKVTPPQLIEMLEIVKRESLLKSRTDNPAEIRGLAAIPGMQQLKELLLEEVVAPLRNPEKYKKYRISIPNGILLYGPPGCGKTFIAQHLAEELGYNFFEISPSSIGSPYVHESGLKIRGLFDNAAQKSPVLIFVDEFEGMVPSRSQMRAEDQYKAEEVNEWLVQINNCADRGILFIAATNEPWKIDEAVRRTGRIDKKVYVGPPDSVAILQMLTHHLKGRPVKDENDLALFAQKIAGAGYSASDIKVLADEAAKLALRSDADISIDHLVRAAAERVPPSITRESEEFYMSFGK